VGRRQRDGGRPTKQAIRRLFILNAETDWTQVTSLSFAIQEPQDFRHGNIGAFHSLGGHLYSNVIGGAGRWNDHVISYEHSPLYRQAIESCRTVLGINRDEVAVGEATAIMRAKEITQD
jgi:hypothetical protein